MTLDSLAGDSFCTLLVCPVWPGVSFCSPGRVRSAFYFPLRTPRAQNQWDGDHGGASRLRSSKQDFAKEGWAATPQGCLSTE